MTSRTEQREGFSTVARTRLLEVDVDSFEGKLDTLRDEINGVKKVLVGVLISLTTASILMVVNILVVGSR